MRILTRTSPEAYLDFWVSAVTTDLQASIELASVGCAVPVREIYSRTRFAPG